MLDGAARCNGFLDVASQRAARYQTVMRPLPLHLCTGALLLCVARFAAAEPAPAKETDEFARTAAKLREAMLRNVEPSVAVPTSARASLGER